MKFKSVYIRHFLTVYRHRKEVRKVLFKVGLYKQGICHDLSKYSRAEFATSAKYFQGGSSPIDAEKREKGYSFAWLHHRGRNPHHWEFWIDRLGTKENYSCKIPHKYVIEMIADWIAAGKVYNANSRKEWTQEEPYNFYHNVKVPNHDILLHPDTEALVEYYLEVIKYEGVDSFIKLAKKYKNMDYIERGFVK